MITHADEVRDQIIVRLRGLIRRAQHLNATRPDIAQALEQLKLLTNIEPGELVDHLRQLSIQELQAFVRQHGDAFDQLRGMGGASEGVDQVVSTHEDELIATEIGYGQYDRPEDYLEAFRTFINDNVNKIAALHLVVTRPRDLTREDLRQLQIALAQHQFSEKVLHAAWKQAKNEDIAATLIGYIRQLTIGSPLVPFSTRVDRAVAKLLASKPWSPPQRRWLERIAKSVKEQVIVDATTFSAGAYANHGGFRAVDAAFDGQALAVIHELEDAVWADVA